MGQPHKHAALIKAWADGAEIEFRTAAHASWGLTTAPLWREDVEYRIKPEEKKPVKRWQWAFRGATGTRWFASMQFYTEAEVKVEYPDTAPVKLLYTETEFPE